MVSVATDGKAFSEAVLGKTSLTRIWSAGRDELDPVTGFSNEGEFELCGLT